MITYLKINGFKSFHNFEMEFTPLTIVAGTNAAGKSNLFDALNLLSRLAEVDKYIQHSEKGKEVICLNYSLSMMNMLMPMKWSFVWKCW